MQSLADLRKEYSKASLDIPDVLPDPIDQFLKWFDDASHAAVPEPNAMNLATVNASGTPSARIVLLKGVEYKKFVFYTNYPACALTFFWPELERQIRIEGTAERIDAERAEKYFQSRPRGSQIGAWSSPQSSVLQNRQILEERVKQMEKKFEAYNVLPKPKQWGGFAVTPLLVEFWQGRESRLHDRIQYTFVDDQWKIYRLAP
jgi:pyridoxamine 5'-phosphate oxidase